MNYNVEEEAIAKDMQLKMYELSWEQFMKDMELRRKSALKSAFEALNVRFEKYFLN